MSFVTLAIAVVKPSERRWWVLATVVAAQFIFVVDAFIVNVAIPSIRADLNATTSEIQGVIVLYQIALATLIITGAAGLAIFAAPSRSSCSGFWASRWLRCGAALPARAASW